MPRGIKDYITVFCKTCNKSMERPRYKSRGYRPTCPDCRGKSVDLVCCVCGKSFRRWKSQMVDFFKKLPYKRNTCSLKCKNISLRIAWNDLTRSMLKQRWMKEFGQLVCSNCGHSKSFNLIIHHKKPVSEGGTNDPSNLEPLCRNCHGEKHYGKIK